MKKTLISAIALIVFAMMIMQSCDSSSSKLDKFMGKWKRSDTTQKDIVLIKKEDEAILIIAKKDTIVARYDKKNDALKFAAFWTDGVIITYNPKNGHLLVNNGKDGEAIRVQ